MTGDISRRDALTAALAGAGMAPLAATAEDAHTYRNPVMAGDHPDPSVLKDGDTYYLVHTSDDAVPGIPIWRSTDLVAWTPIGHAVDRPVGRIWAPDLSRHDGRYFIYFALRRPDMRKVIAVVHADRIAGPWSAPIELDIPGMIDPAHVVGEDGTRYLFLSGGKRVALTRDGLAVAGPMTDAYPHWRYPDAWVVDELAPEGPKVVRRGAWFYLISAVGGTAGPATSHMVTVARSRSIHGPWTFAPNNPIVRTRSEREPWWSRGHAAMIEGPSGDWWLLYHGYANGFRTLGRQLLLEPMAWTADGWPRALGGDLSRPLPRPAPPRAGVAASLSDNFADGRPGLAWTFFKPRSDELDRILPGTGRLTLRARGDGPGESAPLVMAAADRRYRIEVDIEVTGEAEAGILLFCDERHFVGWGFGADRFSVYGYGRRLGGTRPAGLVRRACLAIVNDAHVVSFYSSLDGGGSWVRHDKRFEVSGYHHNVVGDFRALRPALYAIGDGAARFRDWRYRPITAQSEAT